MKITSEFNFRLLNNEEVYRSLVNLNPTIASGADNIPAKALIVAAGQIAPSLAYLFNQSSSKVYSQHFGRLQK